MTSLEEEAQPPWPPDDGPEPAGAPEPPSDGAPEPPSEQDSEAADAAGPSNLLQEAPEQPAMTEAEEQALLKVCSMSARGKVASEVVCIAA